MATQQKHTHHINLGETATQLEMSADPYSPAPTDDFEGKLQEAQQQLEYLQQQRQLLERQKAEMDELTRRKEEFISGQIELSERLSNSITAIDRELFELRQELEDLEQTRQSFAAHLDRLENIEPESWPKETLSQELNRALTMLDQAEDEFDSAVDHFANGRTRGIFGNGPAGATRKQAKAASSDFVTNMKNGLAFNLPVVVLGGIAVILYLLK
jgi:DNA repair exonuclease SbcCD ATPase subunit